MQFFSSRYVCAMLKYTLGASKSLHQCVDSNFLFFICIAIECCDEIKRPFICVKGHPMD